MGAQWALYADHRAQWILVSTGTTKGSLRAKQMVHCKKLWHRIDTSNFEYGNSCIKGNQQLEKTNSVYKVQQFFWHKK